MGDRRFAYSTKRARRSTLSSDYRHGRPVMTYTRVDFKTGTRRWEECNHHQSMGSTVQPNGRLGCTTRKCSDTNSNPARPFLTRSQWRKLWRSYSCQVVTAEWEQRTPGKHRAARILAKSKWAYTSVRTAPWSLQNRSKVILSSRQTFPRSMYRFPSTWNYRACCYWQNFVVLAEPVVVLCGWHASHLPRQSRRIVHETFPSATVSTSYFEVFRFLLFVGFAKSQARGHVDPTWSREIRCCGGSHPGTTSAPGSAKLAFTRATCIFSWSWPVLKFGWGWANREHLGSAAQQTRKDPAQNVKTFAEKCDDGIWKNLLLKICFLQYNRFYQVDWHKQLILGCWGRTGMYDSGYLQTWNTKQNAYRAVQYSGVLRVVLLYDPVIHTKWYIISHKCSTFESHTYAVCDYTCQANKNTDLCNCWLRHNLSGGSTRTARSFPVEIGQVGTRAILKRLVKRGKYVVEYYLRVVLL